jgi:peptide deformylase
MNQNLNKLFSNFQKILKEIPELKFFGEKPLHSKTQDVTVEEGKEIGEKLLSALLKYREITDTGVGMAAPQIGLSKNIFITYIKDEAKIYINPEIISVSDETNIYKELCMSSSMMWGDVERPREITIDWTNEDGLRETATHDGFMARLLQHETDHLKGCVCLDKATPGTITYVLSSPLDEKITDSTKHH